MGLVKRTYVDGETVITADNLNDIQDEIIQNASDISTKGTYSKPSGGIPASDLASGVQTSLGKADTAYQKPSGGIPSTDLASAVQTSLGKADTALQSSDIDSTLTVTGKAADAKKTGDEISGVKNTLNSEIATRQTYVRPNLLDNWYFVGGGSQQGGGQFPINQRGQTTYVTSAYSVDRWKIEIASGVYFSAAFDSNNNFKLTNYSSSTDNAWWTQYVPAFGDGETNYTVSILCGEKTGDGSIYFGGSNQGESIVGNGLTSLTFKTVSGTVGCRIVLPPNSSLVIKAIKLELGSTQTLAHNEGTDANPVWVLNEIPDYDEQMLRCCSSTADSSDTYANKPYNEVQNTLNQLIRPNLLDNWYFVYGKAINNDYSSDGTFPVNQRGYQSYGAGYGIDRWVCDNTPMYCQIETEYLTIWNGINFEQQLDEATSRAIIGKEVTFSILTGSDGLGFSSGIVQDTDGINTVYSTIKGSGTIWFIIGVSPDRKVRCYIQLGHGGSDAHIKAVKLELGSVQTLAHQEPDGQGGTKWVLNEIPNYVEELAKCQRYFIKTGSDFKTRIAQYDGSGKHVWFGLPTPVSMRATPTSVSLGMATLFTPTASSSITPTSATATNLSSIGLTIELTFSEDTFDGFVIVNGLSISADL